MLLIERGELDPDQVAAAIRETFARRNTHGVPSKLTVPPSSWASEFPSLARQAELTTPELDEAFDILREYFNRLKL